MEPSLWLRTYESYIEDTGLFQSFFTGDDTLRPSIALLVGTPEALSAQPLASTAGPLSTTISRRTVGQVHLLGFLVQPILLATFTISKELDPKEYSAVLSLLRHFCDTICFVALDTENMTCLTPFIELWLTYDQVPGMSYSTPIIQLVSSRMFLPNECFRFEGQWRPRKNTYTNVQFFSNSPTRHCKRVVKNAVMSAIYRARAERKSSHILFPAVVFQGIFDIARLQFSEQIAPPVDLLKIYYEYIGIRKPLFEYLGLAGQPVYEKVFKKDCERLLDNSIKPHYTGMPIDGLVLAASKLLERRFLNVLSGAKTTAIALKHHERLLQSSSSLWKYKYSSIVCLACLHNAPRHRLMCGHGLCEPCIHYYGSPTNRRYTVTMMECPLCAEITGPAAIQTSYPTAGLGVLTPDGGGVRGIVSLMILVLLEKQLGLDLPLHRCFNLIVGTSTGGIIALGIGAQKWSLETCIQKFQNLAQAVFRRRKISRVPLIGRVVDIIATMTTGSRYGSHHLDKALRSAFGKRTSLSSIPPAVKLAVTACTSDARPCIFTNYSI